MQRIVTLYHFISFDNTDKTERSNALHTTESLVKPAKPTNLGHVYRQVPIRQTCII